MGVILKHILPYMLLYKFGDSVSSAGDFNGDGKGDVIVGAWADDNNSANASGSAFIFFGGITGTKRADADADVCGR